MRIAIASDWFAPRQGGIEAQLAQLASGLARRGHQVDVVTSTPNAVDGDGYRVRRLNATVLPGVHVALSPSIIGLLRAELGRNYDVVHAHVSVVSPVGYAAAGVARSLGSPTVVTFHSVLRHKRHLLRIADAVAGLSKSPIVWTGVSELVAAQLRSALRTAEVHVLANGIDSTFWAARGTRADRPAAGVTLISTMRLHRKKRPRQLLAAFAQAAARTSGPLVLRIVGEGPERAALERDIRARGLDTGIARVELLGWLSPEALRDQYAAADGFILPSTRESFGIAALEAAVAGLPVIAMADAGCREFLGAVGVLCRDDVELARAIAVFCDASTPRAANLPATNLERYDWASVLAEHEATYRRAIARAAAATTAAVV